MIYNTIKDVATNQGISIYRIEKDLEFPNGLISKWNKSTPSASNLAKVAKYLGVTTEKLLGDGQKGVRMEEFIDALEKEKDHLEKIIKVVSSGGKFLRLPYQKKSRSISENLKLISQNLDRLSEQVQQTTNQHS